MGQPSGCSSRGMGNGALQSDNTPLAGGRPAKKCPEQQQVCRHAIACA
jgi:hypothetical protein